MAYFRRLAWSPIGARVALSVESSRDVRLVGQTLRGVIRATSPDVSGRLTKAVIELATPLGYRGHYWRSEITTVRAVIEKRRLSFELLLLVPLAVRLIDCDVHVDLEHDNEVARAGMALDRA